MNLEISEKERKALHPASRRRKRLELLNEHLYYSWVEEDGEFGVVASGRVSPTLEALYWRLWADDPLAGRRRLRRREPVHRADERRAARCGSTA